MGGGGGVLHGARAPDTTENADVRRFPAVAVYVAIAVLAFVARLLPTLHGGGLGGIDDYDEGVYFAGAQALVAGRLPYRDFVLLHPPGIIVLLAPFAGVARLLSDHRAFELARLAFMALGALNAVLTAVVARRTRLAGPVAATVAGVLYAVWPPAIDAESTTLLTPWNTLGLLVALLLLHRRSARPHEEFLAGAALGAAAAVKIWGVVPLGVVILWQLARRRRWGAARVALGGAAAMAAVCLPFFLAAPGPMFRMVVFDQLRRGEANAGARGRLWSILGGGDFGPGARPPAWLVVVAVAVLCALAVAGALIDRAWLVTALLIAILVLLLAAPSFFAHYAGYAAAPLLVLVGAGSAALATVVARGTRGRSGELTRGQGVVAGLTLGVVPVAVFGSVVTGLQRGTPFPGPQLHDAAASSRCVTADSPVALVQMDLLTRNLERGCRVWIDVTGLTYDTADVRKPDGEPVSRRRNGLWQRALMGYLLSGNATVVVRTGGDGFAPGSARALDQLPILARGTGYALWAVPHGSAGLLLEDLRAATL